MMRHKAKFILPVAALAVLGAGVAYAIFTLSLSAPVTFQTSTTTTIGGTITSTSTVKEGGDGGSGNTQMFISSACIIYPGDSATSCDASDPKQAVCTSTDGGISLTCPTTNGITMITVVTLVPTVVYNQQGGVITTSTSTSTSVVALGETLLITVQNTGSVSSSPKVTAHSSDSHYLIAPDSGNPTNIASGQSGVYSFAISGTTNPLPPKGATLTVAISG